MLHISFSTDELTAEDRKVLALLGNAGDWPATPAPAVEEVVEAPKPAPKAKPAPKPEPTPEPVAEPEPEPAVEATPEPVEDLVGSEGPTLADAVAAATQLVSSGGAPKVKEALASVGAKRVSEIPQDQVAAFLAALA